MVATSGLVRDARASNVVGTVRPSVLAVVSKSLPTGATPQRCPIFGRGVPKTAIAPTTNSQNGTTPTPGIASRTSPGKSSHCQPRPTTARQSRHRPPIRIGGAKLAKAPMTSDHTENLRGVEAVVLVGRFSNSEGAEGSDIKLNRWSQSAYQ